MQMPDKGEVVAYAPQLVPSCLLLFDGLKRAYAARNEAEDSEEDTEDEEGVDSELLESDEDEIDDEGQQYLENLEVRLTDAVGWEIVVPGIRTPVTVVRYRITGGT
jgi:hypothetical protein